MGCLLDYSSMFPFAAFTVTINLQVLFFNACWQGKKQPVRKTVRLMLSYPTYLKKANKDETFKLPIAARRGAA